MVRRLLVIALVLPVCTLFVHGHALAQTTYTTSSLTALLLTQSDVTAVLDSVGLAQTFSSVADVPAATDPIGVGRSFSADDGSFLSVSLFSQVNGSLPSGDLKAGVLDGRLLRASLNGGFDSISGFSVGNSIGGDGLDVLALCAGTINGMAYNVVADSFLRGNIMGIVFYAAPGENDGKLMGAMLGGQVSKLP